jgi:hypothetical protein
MSEMYGSMRRERENKIRDLERALRIANKKLAKVCAVIAENDNPKGLKMVRVDQLRECISESEPCGTYGCTNLRSIDAIMCDSCYAEYREDPDAFK